jgi:hypothetical protein
LADAGRNPHSASFCLDRELNSVFHIFVTALVYAGITMQQTSLYNKLYDVVSNFKPNRFANATLYAEYLHNKELDAFEMPGKGKKKVYCKPETIRKTISLATKFGLVNNSPFELTNEGLASAKSPNSFKNVLAAQIIWYLDQKKFGIQQILDAIDHVRPPDLTEVSTIYDKGKTTNTDIDEPEFRKLLYLLYLCDRLAREIKHLYFRK